MKFIQRFLCFSAIGLTLVPSILASTHDNSPEEMTKKSPDMICKFGDVYTNSKGEFKKVKNPTWPAFIKRYLVNKDSVHLTIDKEKNLITVGMHPFVILSNETHQANPLTTNIRGYLLITSAHRPYLEALVLKTDRSVIEATYFDGITGNIVLGTCKKLK